MRGVLKNEDKDITKHQCAMTYGRASFSKFRAELRKEKGQQLIMLHMPHEM